MIQEWSYNDQGIKSWRMDLNKREYAKNIDKSDRHSGFGRVLTYPRTTDRQSTSHHHLSWIDLARLQPQLLMRLRAFKARPAYMYGLDDVMMLMDGFLLRAMQWWLEDGLVWARLIKYCITIINITCKPPPSSRPRLGCCSRGCDGITLLC